MAKQGKNVSEDAVADKTLWIAISWIVVVRDYVQELLAKVLANFRRH